MVRASPCLPSLLLPQQALADGEVHFSFPPGITMKLP